MNKLNKIKQETLIDEVVDTLVSETYDLLFNLVADAIHDYKIPYGEEHGGLIETMINLRKWFTQGKKKK